VPATRLVERFGLERFVTERVRVDAPVGSNAGIKIGSLIAGMIAGADAIDGMDTLRHGAIPTTFAAIRAPSTLGSLVDSTGPPFNMQNAAQPAQTLDHSR
jgi:hypothetical protein